MSVVTELFKYLETEPAILDSESACEAQAPARLGEPASFIDEYRVFNFEALASVPGALDAFIAHQHDYDI